MKRNEAPWRILTAKRNLPRPPFFRGRSRLIAGTILLLLGAFGGLALPGRVVSVADGDTLTLVGSGGEIRKIRLYGIDSPESRQAGGSEATAFTRSLALFAKVSWEEMDRDVYGRSVAIVTLEDGRILNEELLRQGHAWVYAGYCKTARCLYWKTLENTARSKKAGLWREKKPVPPWLWRRRHAR
jgi:endonuclease YncB( thermonuclease family)